MILDKNKLRSDYPHIRFSYAKELKELSSSDPAQLYKYFDVLADLIKSDNNIMKWTGICILGNLSAVDTKNKIDKYIQPLFKLLHSGSLITANHSIAALSTIAENKPKYKRKILSELLKVSKDDFPTADCRNIAMGKVVTVLGKDVHRLKRSKSAVAFLYEAALCKRNTTKRKAEILIKIVCHKKE